MKTDKDLIFEQYLTVNESSRQNPVIKKRKKRTKRYYTVIDSRGTKRYYTEPYGELHREDGPAVEYANGAKEWWLNDMRHREDGPAIDYGNGYKVWFINDKQHREDGPAVERANGTKSWWVNGDYYGSIPEWTKALFDYKGWTPKLSRKKAWTTIN